MIINNSKNLIALLSFFISFSIFIGCDSTTERLPILGKKNVDKHGDTIYHTIPKFSFVNQDSQFISNKTYDDKIYVADFFFTSCPTICPMMKAQMLRIYNEYRDNNKVKLLSHTIDPEHDSVALLKEYAGKLGVSSEKWSFVTGIKSEIYGIAEDYFSIVMEDEEAPGGFNHSGRLILIDWKGRIRSYCDGTDPKDVDRLMHDIDILLNEYEKKKQG